MVIVSALFFLAITLWFGYIGFRVSKHKSHMKAQVGKTILVGRDTLQVVDYSMLNDHYTLSNGLNCTDLLITKNEIKP